MKRQIKALIIAVPVILLLVGAVFLLKYLVNNQETPIETEKGSYPVISEDSATLNRIDIKNENGEFTIDRIGEETYGIAEYTGYPQSTANYTLLWRGLSSFTSTDKITEPADLEPYGLKNPLGSATVYFDSGLEITVYIGNEAAYSQTDGRYVCIEGDKNVYVLDSSTADLILYPKEDFLSLIITNINYEELTDVLEKMVVSGKNTPDFTVSPAKLTYDGITYSDNFKIEKPYDIYIDSEKSSAVFSTLFNLYAVGIEKLGYENSDLEKYGLKDPTTVVTLTYDGGNTVTITLGDKNEDGLYYLITDVYPVIYKVDPSYADTVRDLSPTSIMSEFLTLPPITMTKQMIIDYKGNRYTYEISSDPSDTEYLEVTLNGEEVPAEDFRHFYSTALKYEVTALTNTPTGEPFLRIEYVYRDASAGSDVMEFYDIGERKYAVQKNGLAVYVTRTTFINDTTEMLKKLLAGEKIVESAN